MIRPLLPFLALSGLVAAAPPVSPPVPPSSPFVVQESGKGFATLGEAVASAKGGDATILIAAGTYHDCAVVPQGRVALRARTPGKTIFDGGLCEGKATLLLRGADAMVDGIVFQNLAVPDGAAAGIRLEHGDLTVMSSVFRASQAGIVALDDPAATIRIDRSTFSGLGRCGADKSCTGAVTIGRTAQLFVTRSRFEKGQGGAYLQAKAPLVSIVDNSFDDSRGRGAGAAIALPIGATGKIGGNTMLLGRDSAKPGGFIVVRAEGAGNPSAGLALDGNIATLAPGVDYKPAFLLDFSREPLRIGANMIGGGIGPVEVRQPPGTVPVSR